MQPPRSWARLPQAGWVWFARGSLSEVKEAVMPVLDGEQFLVRILLGESDQFHHMPLARALLEAQKDLALSTDVASPD